MEKEFVFYKEALELKELKFNEPCLDYFANSNPQNSWTISYNSDDLHRPFESVARPTYSQAFRWFRENHKLFGQVNICTYFIYDMSNHDGFHTKLEMVKQYDELCDNYEEAELACLKKLIEIVESKKE